MAAHSGRQVLADLSATQIPAIASTTALAGLVAGVMAAAAYSQRHDESAALVFTRAVLAARIHPDYGYSRGFLAGVEAAKAELAALANQIGEQS